MMENLTAFANFFASAIRLTAPIALGTLACTISERAGVINIGIEGTMLFSGLIAAVGSQGRDGKRHAALNERHIHLYADPAG